MLAAALALALGATAAAPAMAPPGVEPLRYELSLEVDPREARFRGRVVIEVALAEPTAIVVLAGRRLEIAEVVAIVDGETVLATATPRLAAGSSEPEELELRFERPLAAGRALLVLDYAAPYDTQLRGLYRVHEAGADYAFTQFEPADARRAFPCFDEPRFKTPFLLDVTVPRGMTAFSNSPEAGRERVGAAAVRFRFAATPPLPTYLVALAAGPLEVLPGDPGPPPIRVVTVAGRSALGADAIASARRLLAMHAAYTDLPYPYAKLDLVAVPDFAAGAMENPGLVTFREEILLADGRRSSFDSGRRWTVIAHELAHQYFGNLVSPCGWDEVWLNEGFATWMRSGLEDPDRAARRAETMAEDALPSTLPLCRPVGSTSEAIESLFNRLVFSKGAAVLEMLEGWLGEEAFRAGVRAYLRAHAHDSASSEDLFAALSAASGEDVGAVARSFLDRPGVPRVSVEVDCEGSGGEPGGKPFLLLRQSAQDLRRLPVCARFPGDRGEPRSQCVLLAAAAERFPLATSRCPAWLYPNYLERGYYRYSLGSKELDALTGNLDALAAAEREGLATSLWSMLEAGDLGADRLLASLERFQQPDTARAVIDVLERVNRTLVADPSRPAFRAWVGALLARIERAARSKGGPDDAAAPAGTRKAGSLGRDLLRARGLLALDDTALRRAEAEARAFLRDPRSADLETAPEALALASRRAGRERFDALLPVARGGGPGERVAAVRGLGGFEDQALLRRAFDLALEGDVRAQDFRYLLQSARADPTHAPLLVAWIDEHLEGLRERLPGQAVAALLATAGDLCEVAGIDEAEAALGGRAKTIEGGELALTTALARARRCAALRDREGARASSWLALRP